MTGSPVDAPMRRSAVGKWRLSRHGAQWFERESGLNVLIEELSFPAAAWALSPRYVSIALTNACELRCAFCYAPKVPGRLDAVDVCRWAEELDAGGGLGVGFGGGEPTAHPQFAWLCEQVSCRTQLAVSFTTHGHRLDEDLARRLRGSVHFIRISVDGVGDTYEAVRGRSFAELRRRVAVAASIAPFGINMVVTDHTLCELGAVAAFAAEVGARELLLLPEQPTARGPGLGASGMRAVEGWLAQGGAPLRLAVARSAATTEMPIADPFGPEPELEAHAHVDARGVLRADAYSDEGINVEGSILDALASLATRRRK